MSESEKFEKQGRAHDALKKAKSNTATLKVSIAQYAKDLHEVANLLSAFAADPTAKSPSFTPLSEHLKSEIGQLPAQKAVLDMIDVVHNIDNRLPFPDECVTELLTNHCIEHASWQALPKILKEMHRVLAPGGRLVIRTPDLESIIRGYLNETIEIGHKEEEEPYLKKTFGEITPGTIAILKLFALQNYSNNFHCAVYDWRTIKSLILRAGFSHVDGPHAAPATSKDELQIVARK
jgi:predicted SAM-dependent methyltransferase